jgi:predicted ferric reductase
VTNITNITIRTIGTNIIALLLLAIIIPVIIILALIVAIIVSIKYRSFTATTIALIIVAWLLAGPEMGAIINIVDYTISSVRQMIYPGDVVALLGMWPYIFLLSLLLFYTPAVHQDRRCLAS